VQAAAEAALAAFEGDPSLHAGTAVFSAKTGKLVALVGDRGQKTGARLYSYVTDMRRAPGSALKPLALYAPAIDEGIITEASVFDDVPKSFSKTGVWPHNTPDRFDGLILAKDALIHSKNTVAVDLYRRLGAEHIYATLREKFGITGLCRRVTAADGSVRTDLAEAPLALGELTYGVSLFELSRAYLPFVREGCFSAGEAFFRVEDREGRTLLIAEEGAERAICDYIAGMTDPYAVEQFKKIYIPMGWKVK
jgi:penicillin-binding protein 1A